MVEMKNRKTRSNILSESLKKKNENTGTELILKTVIQENSGNKTRIYILKGLFEYRGKLNRSNELQST